MSRVAGWSRDPCRQWYSKCPAFHIDIIIICLHLHIISTLTSYVSAAADVKVKCSFIFNIRSITSKRNPHFMCTRHASPSPVAKNRQPMTVERAGGGSLLLVPCQSIPRSSSAPDVHSKFTAPAVGGTR